MNNYMKTIISAIKSWVKNDAFTADDALNIAFESEFIKPLTAKDGTVYTTPDGDIYTLN